MRDRSAAEADREAVLAQQRELAAKVAELADEAQRERERLVEELRSLAVRVFVPCFQLSSVPWSLSECGRIVGPASSRFPFFHTSMPIGSWPLEVPIQAT